MDGRDEVVALDREHLIHPQHFTADHTDPLVFVEGRGAVLRDADGREFLDGLACLWNVNVGHGRAELAEAAAEQMRQLAYATAYVGFTNPPAARLARRLVQLSYPNMSAVYFTTSGAESNESAFKIARYFWRRQGKPGKVKIISRVHAYHGVTLAALSATGIPAFQRMFTPLVPEFVHVPPSYPYRQTEDPVEALERAILREGPDTVAAFIAEPVIGSGGLIPPAPDYFPRVREVCDRYDVLLIADEIITGFGRTGKWFALDHWGVRPDLVAFAKGVTSAYLPLGGVLVSRQIHDAILDAPAAERFMHAATYSAHPTCCAVALRNLDILEREGLVERAARMGERLLAGLQTLRDLPVVGDVRGLGLMCGVELVEDRTTKAPALGLGARVLAEAKKRGLVTRIRVGQAGEHPIGDTVLLAPPLVVTEEQVDRIVAILRDSIAACL
ncbi:MAG: aspartate aminotransferase family protein [Armatimonadota bacterium]|nr:aspartate aminotransferase family protein [Armatimonadota bacterium]MDR7413535.1 aspartate aminotransferase family protein [Armatimonadota bacterium]MDR7430625.1 aspartate aminotransferase family protein [Armatimonadota bacterium]MDR7432671.1 aspartate aminotransferase family protein [Armatimonadota bacterium]MDR7462445.1 aspartate aminotransferase family protein [Armatimonadota bacterium]